MLVDFFHCFPQNLLGSTELNVDTTKITGTNVIFRQSLLTVMLVHISTVST